MIKVCGVNLTNTNANNQKAFAVPYEMGTTKVATPSIKGTIQSYRMAA
jgi:hypothetical protein